jgi:hypothetical protein
MCCGAAGLVLYMILMAILDKGTLPKYPKQKHSYDYAAQVRFSEHQRYLRYAAEKTPVTPQMRRRSKPQRPPVPEDAEEPALPDPFAESDAYSATEEDDQYDA